MDQGQLLLHQVQHDEIWHVVRRLGAGRVAMLWERLLGDKSLSDVATLNETMSLTWYSSQELNQSIQLPSSLQSLTFGFDFNQSLEGIQLPTSLQTSATRQPAEFDVRRQPRVQGSRLRVYKDPPKCPLGYLGSLLKGSLN